MNQKIFARFLFCLLGISFSFSFIIRDTSIASAQFQIGGGEATIDVDPRYPDPGTKFTARLADYGQVLGSGDLTWYVDGVAVEGTKNQESITLTAPSLGTPLTIKASRGGYTPQSITKVIVPSAIDVIMEANTTAPYFYKGRRLPALGAPARIVIIPHIYDTKGAELSANDLVYTWNIDTTNVENGGKGALELSLSNLGEALVLLSIESRNHQVKYQTTFYIETTEPILAFYTYNPLNGLSQNAIQDSYLTATDEITIRAQPYFVASDIYRGAQYGWSVNGQNVQNASVDPQMITLRKSGNGGISDISFVLRNLSALSQYVQGLFRIDFK